MGRETPLISVLVPVRNEARYLRACLGAVLAQTYPPHLMEIFVVDGCSTDETPRIAREMAAVHPNIRVLENPARLAAPALNLGVRQAHGEIVVRVDGHTVIAPDYVERCVEALRSTGADVVGGPRQVQGAGFWGRVIASALASPFGSPARFHRSSEVTPVDSVFLGAFLHSTLLRVGLFDERLPWNEDYELNYRIRSAGGRVVSTPAVRSLYFGRGALPALVKQFWGYGRGKAMVLRRHPSSAAPRHLVAPLFVAALGGTCALAAVGRRRPLVLLLGCYGAASACFSWRAAAGGGPRLAAGIAVAFACVHVSWGAGLLRELLRPEARC